MFAKIENGIISFISKERKSEDMIELSQEENEILSQGGFYQDGIFYKKEKTIEEKIQEIKQKYQDLIFSKYSLTDQLNMSNEAMQIMAFAQFEKRDFTEEEKTRLFEIQEAKVWIDAQRVNCKNEILELGN